MRQEVIMVVSHGLLARQRERGREGGREGGREVEAIP